MKNYLFFNTLLHSNIFHLILSMIMGRYRLGFTQHIFNGTMGVHDSYRETFTLSAVTTKETKVRGE